MQLALKWGWLEAWGTEMMYPHYSTAWAWAGNTPFRWGKQVASHLGGTRNPLVIRWPARVKDSGGLRSQFTHVTDVGPTILDIAGIPQPTHVDGVEQQPMTGVTFAGSLADLDAPERHSQQCLVVGLFAPPLLASVVVGGAAGSLVGKFARHRVESGLEERMGAALPPGSAGIVAIYDRGKAGTVDATLASAVRKSVAQVGGGGVKKLKAALVDAQAGLGG